MPSFCLSHASVHSDALRTSKSCEDGLSEHDDVGQSHLSDAELLDEALLGAGIHHRNGRVNARRNEVKED